MPTYIKFLFKIFMKSFLLILFITLCLVIVLNILAELDFFSEINVNNSFLIYLSVINSPSLIFDLFPFIFLLTTQLFFINLSNNNELIIFKYSGLKNSKILSVISILSFCLGLIVITLFYNFSSSLKNIYLEVKSKYASDGRYLAVITNNGIWIKDEIDNKINIINASKIKPNSLLDVFISQFDGDFNLIQNIKSEKINISSNKWIIEKPEIFETKNVYKINEIEFPSNFNYNRIKSLFSNLSSLSLLELFELRDNYKSINYSITEIDIQILKIFSYPIFLTLMTIFSFIIMLKIKDFFGNGFKISLGLFLSVIIYYLNNFFIVLGETEKISIIPAIWLPLFILALVNTVIFYKINDK